jgi:lactate dehydrogenase-like 2-hydroxyacid dehydrogenase
VGARPAVLIVQPHLAPVAAFLAPVCDVFSLAERPPLEATARIRALVVAGEFELDKSLVQSLPNLGLIACFTAGYDGIDVAWARSLGLEVTHAPNVNDEDVADHALGLIIASVRRIADGDRQVRAGEWLAESRLITPSLGGKRLGIVGLGGIGRALALRAEACRMQVAWWGPREKPGAPWPRAASLIDLARAADVLAVCCKADESSRGLISRAVIEAVGPAGLIVNVSRGQVLDEDALIEALRSGRLGAAALDVFRDEPTAPDRWADVPNAVLTPHTAGATAEAVHRMVALLAANLQAFFAGEPVRTPAT